MTQDSLQTVCAACGGVNRIPSSRLAAGAAARCGMCGGRLFSGAADPVNAATFQRSIERSDIPVLVDFWAPWCGPCRALAPAVESVARTLSPELRVLKLNIDEAQDVRRFIDVVAAVFAYPSKCLDTYGQLAAGQGVGVTHVGDCGIQRDGAQGGVRNVSRAGEARRKAF